MDLECLKPKYDALQKKYGAKHLRSIYFGGCEKTPKICFVFMNPTGRNIASLSEWKGIRAPWIGTKNIWDLFYALGLLDEEIFLSIKSKKGSEWTEEFAKLVYEDVSRHDYFITNLGKCTQIDARPLPNSVFLEYLSLLEKEFEIIKPNVIILFGNQVSSLVLNEKISVSKVRRTCFMKEIRGTVYRFYSVYYPVGNGRFHIQDAISDIEWIIREEHL